MKIVDSLDTPTGRLYLRWLAPNALRVTYCPERLDDTTPADQPWLAEILSAPDGATPPQPAAVQGADQ